MKNQNPFNQSNNNKPKKKRTQHNNFLEALKSIGGSTKKSLKDDLIKGTASDIINSFSPTSGAPKQPDYNQFNPNRFSPDSFRPDWLSQREDEALAEERRKQRHRELNLQPLYDRGQEEVKAQIKALQEELSILAKDLGRMGTSIQNAIEAEIENPGTYHVNFFEKLKAFVHKLRLQVNDSANWLEVSSQRKQAKKYYWGQVKKSGTKFMQSKERTLATQTG